jgi:hypothetical protein
VFKVVECLIIHAAIEFMNKTLTTTLMALLCATLAVVGGLRVREIAQGPDERAGWATYVLERHTAFGDDGPAWQSNVLGDRRASLIEIFGSDAAFVPLVTRQTIVTVDGGPVVPVRLLEADGDVAHLLPVRDGGRIDDECTNARVLLDRRLGERLGLANGGFANVGGRTELIDAQIHVRSLRLFPSGLRVDGIRCVANQFAGNDSTALAALVVVRKPVDETRLQTMLHGLATDDGSFQSRWQLVSFEQAAAHAGQRTYGWMLGLEALLAMLSAGLLILLRILVYVRENGDAWLRQALGEQRRHRIARHLGASCRDTLIVTGTAGALGGLAVGSIVALSSSESDLPGFLAVVAFRIAAVGVAFGVLRFLIDMALDTVFARRSAQANDARATNRSAPAIVATLAAAALSAAICVPAAFLLAELLRHAASSPGYRTQGLYTVPLVVLNHDTLGQEALWERLRLLRDEIAAVPGVHAAAYLEPAPWRFAGSPGVVDNDDEMILNVGVVEGTFSILAPSGWNGREIIDEADMTQVIVQNLDEANRRNFIQPGTAVIGEIRHLRFSPLDETGRQAIVRSLRAGIGESVELIMASTGKFSTTAVANVLQEHQDWFAAGPLQSVERILAERLEPVRASAAVASVTAAAALLLLALALLLSVRLYAAAHRRDLAIRMCLGGDGFKLQGAFVLRCLAATAIGWALGTMVGLLVWHQMVALIRDHRLVQPWPSYWLLPVALAIVLPYYWHLTRTSFHRISIGEALKA